MRADTPLRIDLAAEESPQNRTPSAFIRPLRRLEHSKGLDPVVRVVEPLASWIVANERLRRLLHGDATGIPLHVIFTDVPFGAWFMAQFLDLSPDDGTRRAATRLVGLGLWLLSRRRLPVGPSGRGRTAAPGVWGSSTPRRTPSGRSSS
jgi:hypothetical protein